ncbi:unnamed protein product, partial [Brachionus calyciflorus]
MQNISFIPSFRGNPMILIYNHIFIRWATRDNGAIYWKCIFKKKSECKASLTTSSLNTKIVSSKLVHSDHKDFSSLDVRLYQCLDNVGKRSREEHGSIHSIFRDEINKILEQEYDKEELASKMPKYDNIRDRFYTKRNQDIPSLLKSLETIDHSLQRFQNTTYKKRFLRIIAFASDIQLEILSKSKRWHVD